MNPQAPLTRKDIERRPKKTLISREEVAALIDASYDQVRRNEKRWGISGARRDLSPRDIRYSAKIVWAAFSARGWV